MQFVICADRVIKVGYFTRTKLTHMTNKSTPVTMDSAAKIMTTRRISNSIVVGGGATAACEKTFAITVLVPTALMTAVAEPSTTDVPNL